MGAIVLLKKKADQTRLTNKRPITLLNTIYKIGAKTIQRRVTPILQCLISPQQAAFLPGRNIHHSVLLLSEMLHQAEISGEEHILLKLDVHKAFDSLEWPYILATVEQAGMNGILFSFLKASFSSASSHIILNGRPTESFQLARSVRQGCPLSPLIFILAYDNLSPDVFRRLALNQGLLRGVEFPDTGLSTLLAMFADDTNVLIRAEIRYIEKIKEILDQFGAASGLRFIWENTKAVFIPGGPPPMGYWLFPWTWEEDSNATKTLGFHTASSIPRPLMEAQIQGKVETSIGKLNKRKLSLAGRITAANSLILGTVWYIVTLWAGDLSFLSKLQTKIEIFVWAGRSRVNRNSTTQSKVHGGLGLILIIEQYRAIAGNLMLWVLGPEAHPLKTILCSHLRELQSRNIWGIPDFTWVVTKGGP